MDQLVSVAVSDGALQSVVFLPRYDGTLDLLNRVDGSSCPVKHLYVVHLPE